jgi:hypothetical protein
MIHPDFNWFEFRAVGQRPRTIVPATYLESELDRLGTSPTNVHLSIFRFSDDIKEYRDENDNRTRGYRGPAYADYLPVDIDAPSADELGEAVETARTVLSVLTGDWELTYEDIACYYSGRRGFHIMVPTRHFWDFDPTPHFHDLLFELAAELFVGTPVMREVNSNSRDPVVTSDLVDLGCYSRLHMLRMPGTIHEDTQLWKIPVREHELLEGAPEEAAERIQEAATTQRPTYRPESNPTEKTRRLGKSVAGRIEEKDLRYRRVRDAVGTMDTQKRLTADDLVGLDKPGFGRFAASAKKEMKVLSGGIEESETIVDIKGRHEALCYLVGKLKNQFGVPKDWATGLLHHWNQSHPNPLGEREFYGVIDDLYD